MCWINIDALRWLKLCFGALTNRLKYMVICLLSKRKSEYVLDLLHPARVALIHCISVSHTRFFSLWICLLHLPKCCGGVSHKFNPHPTYSTCKRGNLRSGTLHDIPQASRFAMVRSKSQRLHTPHQWDRNSCCSFENDKYYTFPLPQ